MGNFTNSIMTTAEKKICEQLTFSPDCVELRQQDSRLFNLRSFCDCIMQECKKEKENRLLSDDPIITCLFTNPFWIYMLGKGVRLVFMGSYFSTIIPYKLPRTVD